MDTLYPDDLLSQAKARYKGQWDDDAQQQFDYRQSVGQSAEDILGHTAEDYTARYASGGQAAPSAPSPYTGAAAGAGDQALSQFTSYLQSRDQATQQQQAALREILMGQLGQASQPVSADAPGIREVLGGQRLALQRGAERQRAGAAEQRAYDGSGGLGGKAFTQDVSRINEHQAETDATMTGNVLHQELQNKRQQLTQLLAMATQLGDAESARLLQGQLNAIQTQLSQSNFYDSQAYNYSALNQQGNLATLMALLNAA